MAQEPPQPAVLHINDARTWRGGEQQTLYLARGMSARGLRTGLACRPGAPLAQRGIEAGLDTHQVRMLTEVDPLAALRIARLARRGGFNILHAHTAHAHGLAWLAQVVWRCRCRLVVHRRIEFAVGRRAWGLSRMKYGPAVDAFIAVSDGVKGSLVRAGIQPWRIFTVHSATDPQRFLGITPNPLLRDELGIPRDAFVVGNVGYLVGHKDHANLLRAAALALPRVPNLYVVIVGPGPLEGDLVAMAQQLGISGRVIFTGFRTDIPQLLRSFDLFALSSSEEGLCGSVLEAMASELAIVATDAAGMREAMVDGQTGLLVPIRDSAALAGAIVRMAQEPETARRMAAAALKRMLEHFTADGLTEGTLEVYRRVLAGQVAPPPADLPAG